jgi:hypothetical protein
MPCHLPDLGLAPHTYCYELAMRTFHYHLHVINQAVNNGKGLRDGRLRLFESESIKP